MRNIPLKELVLSHDVKVVVWQWPEHRVLWGKQLRQGDLVSVVAEGDDGVLICNLDGNHYFMLWPENVSGPREPAVAP
ncbi:MAG TPA: hypothetical protein VJ085_05130 [Candidatus Acidoferrales bacterium]|nr:hypothetical protein [Candidatus Acidoferrales bacterium]